MAILISICFFSSARYGVFICSFAAAIGAPVGIAGAIISLVFLVSYGILKMFLKSWERKKANTEKLFY